VPFQADTNFRGQGLCIDSVHDQRIEDTHFVSYNTKKKFLIIPVDQEIHTTRPLSEILLESLADHNGCITAYTLKINRFEIERRKERFASVTYLKADIPVFENKNDSQYFIGTLYYDHLYHPQQKREPRAASTENHLQSWHRTLRTDLIKINAISKGAPPELAPNLIRDPAIPPLFLNFQTGLFTGLNWYGVQAELYFNRPETESRNKQVSGIVRYQNNADYESFAFGRNSEHYKFRINDNFVFDIDLNILFGFLKWKDIKVHKPSIYQIINIEASSIQSFMFAGKNKRGFTGRLGAIETAGYVFDKKMRWQAGLFLGLGYTF
ncbi:MAG: hypothetical protein R6W78_16700, partial [Bacteroidales bacterium]